MSYKAFRHDLRCLIPIFEEFTAQEGALAVNSLLSHKIHVLSVSSPRLKASKSYLSHNNDLEGLIGLKTPFLSVYGPSLILGRKHMFQVLKLKLNINLKAKEAR